ncbi:MAG: hypothetical protein H6Q78_1177, partial [Candidatus Krumholzibacteriota bacterium]|nr:hypothetical protein [Candidatus Krumholzibacteriota bacterium]
KNVLSDRAEFSRKFEIAVDRGGRK